MRIWCNGSTRDFQSFSRGSNPRIRSNSNQRDKMKKVGDLVVFDCNGDGLVDQHNGKAGMVVEVIPYPNKMAAIEEEYLYAYKVLLGDIVLLCSEEQLTRK